MQKEKYYLRLSTGKSGVNVELSFVKGYVKRIEAKLQANKLAKMLESMWFQVEGSIEIIVWNKDRWNVIDEVKLSDQYV